MCNTATSRALQEIVAAYSRVHQCEPSPIALALAKACVASFKRYRLAEVTLQALETDDPSLAAALQTLVGAVGRGQTMTPPLSLRLALGTPNATLPLFDRESGARLGWMRDDRYATLCCEGEAPIESLVIGSTGLRLTATRPAAAFPSRHIPSGCIVSLLTLPQTDETTLARFREWLGDKTVRLRCHRLLPVERGTLLATLVTHIGSLQLDLPALCSDPDRPHAAQLADTRGYLLVSSPSETHALLQSARDLGFCVRAFARTNNKGTFSMSERDELVFSLPVSVLRSLDRPRRGILRISATDEPDLVHLPRTTDHRPADGWRHTTVYPADTPVRFGAWTVIHTTFVLDNCPSHRQVTEQLTRAALRLVAAGGDFETMIACTALSLHPNRSTRPAWLAALGLRALTEAWHVALADTVVTATEDDGNTLTVCLIAKALPTTAHADHRTLRLLAAPPKADGTAPLASLAALLRTASRAVREGRASAPIAWIDRAVSEGLSGLVNAEADVSLRSAPDAALCQCGLLIRADETVTEGIALACLPTPTETSAPCDDVAPRICSALHVAHPTVLLPVPPDVDKPMALIEPLRRMGASVCLLPCTPTHDDLTALADAIATCDLLILNGAPETLETMLAHRRVDYALASRLPHHATLVLVGRAAELTLPERYQPIESCRLHRLPSGISLDLLSKLVKYYQ